MDADISHSPNAKQFFNCTLNIKKNVFTPDAWHKWTRVSDADGYIDGGGETAVGAIKGHF